MDVYKKEGDNRRTIRTLTVENVFSKTTVTNYSCTTV